MDDTSSLPTTNIINLSCDRSKFFLVFFVFLKRKKQINKREDLQKSRITERNSTKNQTQAIKNNSL
jgi:hypothetical protein